MILVAMLAACVLWTADPPALRPVDAAARTLMGFAGPRAAEVILGEIDALPERDTSQPTAAEGWAELRRKSAEVAARRVALVSELEESGYAGARLAGLQRDKLIACSEVALRAYGPLNEALGVMWEVRDRHAGEPLGALARLMSYRRVMQIMGHAGMEVSQADVRRIADAEVEAASGREPGAIGEALVFAVQRSDRAARGTWYDWMVEHLPADSGGARTAMRERAFGKPIRLTGPSLTEQPVDTEAWRGSVVLVDFWGTWCGPCVAELPEIEGLRRKYSDLGLRVVGVLEDTPETGRAFLDKHGYDWPQIVDPEHTDGKDTTWTHPIARRYAVNEHPTVWLIDRAGVLVKAPVDGERREAKLRELLGLPEKEGAAPGGAGGTHP